MFNCWNILCYFFTIYLRDELQILLQSEKWYSLVPVEYNGEFTYQKVATYLFRTDGKVERERREPFKENVTWDATTYSLEGSSLEMFNATYIVFHNETQILLIDYGYKYPGIIEKKEIGTGIDTFILVKESELPEYRLKEGWHIYL